MIESVWFCQLSGREALGCVDKPKEPDMPCPRCNSPETTTRPGTTSLGYSRFVCHGCKRRFNERTGTLFNDLQYPTDVVLNAVLWRLHYKLSLRDVAEVLHGPGRRG